MKWLWLGALVFLAGLQYRLWVVEGSLERNRVLTAEVIELKQGVETVEERARHELGMVKQGETLFQLSGE